MDASLDDRVMNVVRALPAHRRARWSVSPLAWGLAAAGIALMAVLGATLWPLKEAAPPQRVQFVLVAPDAKKVAVVGDFNGWDAAHTQYQAQHRGGGVWAVTAPVPVGHHRYSFIVDDSLWVADPYAPRVVDKDFGVANSALVVEANQ